jgi:transposase
MVHFVGLEVSVKATSVCVVDDAGKVMLEQKVSTDPADIIAILTSLGVSFGRIGIEAGPLSQWLVNALTAADLPVICVETRHMKALLTAQQISKTDRNDARGIAQMMRVGLFKPVHAKTLVAQEQRMLLTSRKLLQRKLLDVESDFRGTLRNFGLKVGVVGGSRYEGYGSAEMPNWLVHERGIEPHILVFDKSKRTIAGAAGRMGEVRPTRRWREPDSNHRSRSCERLFWALPIGDGGTNGGATYRFRSETAMACLEWLPTAFPFAEGPMVRIHLPPASPPAGSPLRTC